MPTSSLSAPPVALPDLQSHASTPLQYAELCYATPQPWANGKGATRTLALDRDSHEWRWRISVADMTESAEFSRLPGVHRWLALACGGPLTLVFQDFEARTLERDNTTEFDGRLDLFGKLAAGPLQVLNLMLRGLLGALTPLQTGHAWCSNARIRGLYTSNAATLHRTGAPAVHMAAQSLVWSESPDHSSWLCVPHMSSLEEFRAWWIEVDCGKSAPQE